MICHHFRKVFIYFIQGSDLKSFHFCDFFIKKIQGCNKLFCGSRHSTTLPTPTNQATNQPTIHSTYSIHQLQTTLLIFSHCPNAVCGMNFSTFEDKITTPDFPRVYQSSSPCTHYINLPETLNITFAIRTSLLF